ncbi:hypothetical protein N0V88_000607 [Collariella sp. IMI 366227]|nr:hypothetical protein N0V88_000607 [Collariella sp. IMI 366227]
MASFRIRDALPTPTNTDAAFITSALDSCIPHLATIGSAAQWGSVSFSSARPDMINRHISAIADASAYRSTGSGPPIRVLIAEAQSPASGEYVPVGSATLKGYLPGFYTAQGFEKVDGFVVKKPDGEKWPGMLLRMDLGKENAE